MPANPPAKRCQAPLQLMAMNIAGAEFSDSMPGQHGHHYTWPRAANFQRYVASGFKLVRLPFRWERIQHSLFADLDPDEMQRFMAALDGAHEAGMQVLLDMHNYYERKVDDREYVEIGRDPQVSVDAWIDAWLKLVARVSQHPAVWGYGLMNEPKGTEGRWAAGAQRCVDAIRAVDPTTPIIIAGDGFSTAQFWEDQNGAYFPLRGEHLLYEAHIYLDRDTSGRYADLDEDIHPNIGVYRAVPFFNWLKAHGQQGFLGELGVPEFMPKALRAMDRLLAYAVRNQIPVFYWAGGSQWNEGHETSCEYNGELLGQVEWVTRHLHFADRIGPVDRQPDEQPSLLPEEEEVIDPEPEPGPGEGLRVASQFNPINAAVQAADSGGAQTEYAFRFPFFIGGGDVAELVLSLSNWFLPPHSRTGEDTGNLLPFTGLAVEFNGQVQPVTFDGSRSFTLWDGAGDVHADPLAADLFGLSQFDNDAMGWIKGVIHFNGAGHRVPRSWRTTHDQPGSSVSISDPAHTTLSDLYQPGAFTHQGAAPRHHDSGYCPIVLGRHVGEPGYALFMRGDTQSTNYGDAALGRGSGWFQRWVALHPRKPGSINFAVPNATAVCGLDEHRLSALLEYCPDGGCLFFGSYDLNGRDASTAEELFAQLLEHIEQCRRAGASGPIAVARLLPRTRSSDQWASDAGQTVVDGWAEGDAPARFNAMVAPDAFDCVLSNDAVRSPGDPCKWLPASERVPFDEMHLASPGHRLLAEEAYRVWR
ncbi:glycoside hydrolase family 5 protein [Pseudomonas sp. HR96]|uniref:glycoside hydrolase family 5 protein n=1 Tax=Pseudomonas sp. HR96 TaxID=1027966 RepID=UPI002A74ECE7|nr:glycoside hydrolase family 5 protein [Pseudomonas sp. HR96]WPO98306.1 glycoside hydrolase family 5 protein [Pseudomonas sp. HR96]